MATVLVALVVFDDVDLLVARDFAAAAFDVDFEPVPATLERRELPRTTSSWPGWITAFLRPLSRMSALTDVPVFLAIPPNVSPRFTT